MQSYYSQMDGTLKVAFGCQARVGKDTAVEYLAQIYPKSKRLAFADPLYDIHNYAHERLGFPTDIKDRRFLQWVGTEWGRYHDPDVWVRLARQTIENIPENTSIFVSDVRFPNEMKMLREQGFKLVRLIRGEPIVEDGLSIVHSSETSLVDIPLMEWDYVIYNDGTIDDLRFKLKQMAKKLESPHPNKSSRL